MNRIPLFLSSAAASGAYNKSADGSTFTVSFSPPLEIPSNRHIFLKVLECNIWYNTINISAAIGNNSFFYSDDLADDTKFSVVIADGIYSVSDLNSSLDLGVVANGHTTGTFQLLPEDSTQKVLLKIDAANWQVNFTESNTFRNLIGFNSQKVPASALTTASLTTRADNVANFSDLEHILLHSTLGGASVLNGSPSTAIATITPDISPGSLIISRPTQPIEVPISPGTYIDTLTFWLTTQDGVTRFNTNSEDYSFRMVILML